MVVGRQIPGTSLIVGECCVQGIMDGQVMTTEQFRVEGLMVAYFRSMIRGTFFARAILNTSFIFL
jgi:hypothetical protein